MSNLHTISKSPDSNLLDNCLKTMSNGDAVLFIEDGVYHSGSARNLQAVDETIKIYALREDILARALLAKIDEKVVIIDAAGFVELCCQHNKVIGWF